jgi:hypothetical protein
MNGPRSNCIAWLSKAENDLLNIENNLSAARVPWDTICFHAQQAAEKLLKGWEVCSLRKGARFQFSLTQTTTSANPPEASSFSTIS